MLESGVTPPRNDRGGHLSENDLAAYLDRDLTPDERRRVETHLDGCAECRAELAEILRLADDVAKESGAGKSRRARRWWIPVAIAAGLVAVLLPLRTRLERSPAATPLRAPAVGAGEGETRLAIVSPPDNATIQPTGIVFTWRSAPAHLYDISVLTESGDLVWSSETADTTATLPLTVSLERARAYFWRVDAVAGGITATTGAHRLQIAP